MQGFEISTVVDISVYIADIDKLEIFNKYRISIVLYPHALNPMRIR